MLWDAKEWCHHMSRVGSQGKVCKLEKVVGTIEALLGGEVYHYHTKVRIYDRSDGFSLDKCNPHRFYMLLQLIMKEKFTGGAFVWHQDYGYWYNNGILRPDMATVMIALDEATAENGCLQVIPRSHKFGRINHIRVGEQTGADAHRIADILKHGYAVEHVTLKPGDAVFFHSNLLHQSSQNRSPMRRWCFLCSYNRVDNPAMYSHHHPSSGAPIEKLPNDTLLICPKELPVDAKVKDFMVPVTFNDDARYD
jgi:hypothetical protein